MVVGVRGALTSLTPQKINPGKCIPIEAHLEQGGDSQSGNAPVAIRDEILEVHVT